MAKAKLPHQVHRALGTVKLSDEHVARVKAARKRERSKDAARSAHWPTTRRKFLAALSPRECLACGAKVGLQVHHVKPFHTEPGLELDPSNLVALCEYVGGLECHEFLGHGGDFHHANPFIRDDAAELREHPERLQAIQARAKARRIPNEPTRRAA